MRGFPQFAAAIWFFVCCNSALPGDSPYMRLSVDGSISVKGDPEVNPEVTIIFRFMLKPECPFYRHMKELEEMLRKRGEKGDFSAAMGAIDWAERVDHASLHPDTNVEYLTDPAWTGQLKPLQKYELTVKARLRHRMPTQIAGVVEAYCGTAAFPSPCRAVSFFVSDTLFRDVEMPKPPPPKPDTIWQNGHMIIHYPSNYSPTFSLKNVKAIIALSLGIIGSILLMGFSIRRGR